MGNKFIFLLHLLLLSGIVSAQQKPFTLSGSIQGKTGGYIYLSYTDDDGGKTIGKSDSARIENGRFSFKGQLSGPVVAYLSKDRQIRTGSDNLVQLYLVPGTLQFSADYNNFRESAVLKGSPVQDEAEALEKSKAVITAQMKLISDAYGKALALYKEAQKAKTEEAILESLKEAADLVKEASYPLGKQAKKIELAFMDQHPTSYVTASKLRWLLTGIPYKEGQERYNKLPEEIKRSNLGKTIKAELDEFAKGAPGARGFQFASTEIRGGELKLSDYKGKYVLLDFWASWCVPCRKGNPHLLSLYAKYKEKGLEIIGISDDDKNPGAWKKAVEKDGIGVWKHVLRGLKQTPDGRADRSSSISDQYGTATLPTKILIDPQGMIIGRYGADGETDEALDKKLAEIFGR